MAEINFFAKTNFRNQERVFGIKKDDRRRHMYVVGKTGMGKSNLLENMAIQDIRNGEGVCVVDPHGEFAEKMIKAIPAERINDVVYFNPADKEFPLAFNILESVDEDKKNLVASGMMGVFKKIWPDVWSPRMEYILNNTILALLDYPGSTMLGVNRMMFDKDYRKKVYPKIKDPVVKSFWINEFDKWEDKFRKEAVAAIQNKVGQFLSSAVIRNIVGQPKSTIDMREVMDNQKILIVNLSKGRIGEDAMRLLGGMIVTKLQLAAMGRVEIPEEERKDFYLYVDEMQNFVTESFANILSEARKYRLCLILAHQYISQLTFDGNNTVRDAIFGNAGTLVTFRVGAEDAEFLEKEFDPIFLMNDLVNLSKYHIYLKLMIDGIAGDAFSATALPPLNLLDTLANEEKVVKVSRERYGKSREEVEEKIARWSGMLTLEEYENFAKEKRQLTGVAANETGDRRDREAIRNVSSVAQEPSGRVKNVPSKAAVVPATKPAIPALRATGVKINEVEKKTETIASQEVREEKPMYEAVCDTCEEKVIVPFKPDPTRPTFCKECLKEYQRARARAQNEQQKKEQPSVPNWQSQHEQSQFRKKETDNGYGSDKKEARRYSPAAYVSKDKPISLTQVAHIAPKKFKPTGKKPEINLSEVRDMINRSVGKRNGQT